VLVDQLFTLLVFLVPPWQRNKMYYLSWISACARLTFVLTQVLYKFNIPSQPARYIYDDRAMQLQPFLVLCGFVQCTTFNLRTLISRICLRCDGLKFCPFYSLPPSNLLLHGNSLVWSRRGVIQSRWVYQELANCAVAVARSKLQRFNEQNAAL
jgi:hypothetical protein